MLHLQRKKIFITSFCFAFSFLLAIRPALAQRELNNEEHDFKPYYFGISLGLNQASFQTHFHPAYLQQDSIQTAEPLRSAGFNLGLSATARLNQRLEIRFNPQLIFTERNLQYQLRFPDPFDNSTTIFKKVESVITSFPIQVRFLSDRIGNMRVYMMGGGKFDLDLASNAQTRKGEDMIKIGRTDYGVEAGLGFKFYYPSFILAPEIKFSNGFNNLHDRNPKLNYSSVIDGINSRMITFTIHLEG